MIKTIFSTSLRHYKWSLSDSIKYKFIPSQLVIFIKLSKQNVAGQKELFSYAARTSASTAPASLYFVKCTGVPQVNTI